MNRRTFLAGVVGATSVTLAGCSSVLNMGSESRSMGGDYDIGTSSMDFHPDTFTATVGETVVWKNTGMRQHTVTPYENRIPDGAEYFASGGFDSEDAARNGWNHGNGGILQGRTFKHTFTVPGKYDYFCVPHESRGMVGTIVVKEQ